MTAPKPDAAPAVFKAQAVISLISSFFYTYDDDESTSGHPVIAGVRFGPGIASEITVYTQAQAQEIADAFTGLVTQFAEHETRKAGESR